jgi:hypothetical protein
MRSSNAVSLLYYFIVYSTNVTHAFLLECSGWVARVASLLLKLSAGNMVGRRSGFAVNTSCKGKMSCNFGGCRTSWAGLHLMRNGEGVVCLDGGDDSDNNGLIVVCWVACGIVGVVAALVTGSGVCGSD